MPRLRATLLSALTACAATQEAPAPANVERPAASSEPDASEPTASPPDLTALSTVAQPGDIVLQQSKSAQATALRDATHSWYTHTGLLLRHADTLQVLEAVDPVRWTPLGAWVARGLGRRVVLLRLKDPTPLAGDGVDRLTRSATRFLGRHEDTRYEWSDDRLYSAELVYKAFKFAFDLDIGKLQQLGDLDLASPAARALVDAEGSPSDHERVVTPASLLTDPDLIVVYSSDPKVAVTAAP